MPVVTLATPGIEWENLTAGPFRVGHFNGALITFLVIAFAIFILAKITKKWGIE